MNSRSNIYECIFEDGRKETLKTFGMYLFFFFWTDFMILSFLDMDIGLFKYIILFHVFSLTPFVYMGKWLYLHTIYLPYAIVITTLPSLILVYLAYLETFGIFGFSIFFLIYLYAIYFSTWKTFSMVKYDYKIAAKNLLYYNNPPLNGFYTMDVKASIYTNDVVGTKKRKTEERIHIFTNAIIKEKKKKGEEVEDSIFTKVLYATNPLVLVIFPSFVFITCMLFLSQETMIFITFHVFFITVSAGIPSTITIRMQYRILFKEAQRMLDEKAKK